MVRTGSHLIVKFHVDMRLRFFFKLKWQPFPFVWLDVLHRWDSHAFCSRCQWATIWKMTFGQSIKMSAKSDYAQIFACNSTNSFDSWNSNGLLSLPNYPNPKWGWSDLKLKFLSNFIHRLLLFFFEIYQIILIILFLGVLGAILLALLMIQMDLARVIPCK